MDEQCYQDSGHIYLGNRRYSGVVGRNGNQSIVDAKLVEHPIDQLHLYVRILFGGRIEGPFRILGLWSQAVYILYGPAQFLRRNHKVRHLTLGIWIG